MTLTVKDEDLIKGKISPSSISGKYVFLRVKAGMTGVDMDKAMEALNIMAENGWIYRQYVLTGKSVGFVMEKK